MGCSSCSNGVNGLPRGCKNRGVCSSDSCNNLTVFNWLENMSLPQGKELFPFVEVRFKNSRKEFYNFYENIPIQLGMLVVIKLENGYDIGTITLKGELVKIQMKLKKTSSLEKSIGKIVRVANEKEIEIWKKARSKEAEVQKKARELAIKLKLEMKLSDVEFQGDGKKATFYYTSENRVDFRQLIKDMARVFSIRIEMRQIGLRQEASRLGGIGSCGRELCCSSWLTDFRSVSTSAARYQQLSLNPEKLSGQCGKLKCCLNYELDSYRSALKDFPKKDEKLLTEKGVAIFQKMDIFKGIVWYSYKDEWTNWYKLTTNSVKYIIEKNKLGITVSGIEEYVVNDSLVEDPFIYSNLESEGSLTRFDSRAKIRTKKHKSKKIKNQ